MSKEEKLTTTNHYFSMTLEDMHDIECQFCKEKEIWVEHEIKEITDIGYVKPFECSVCGLLVFFKSKYDKQQMEFIS